jgi:hypothetical protein
MFWQIPRNDFEEDQEPYELSDSFLWQLGFLKTEHVGLGKIYDTLNLHNFGRKYYLI